MPCSRSKSRRSCWAIPPSATTACTTLSRPSAATAPRCRTAPPAPGRRQRRQLLAAIGAPSRAASNSASPAGLQILTHLLEAGAKLPRAARQAQKGQASRAQQLLDLPRQIARQHHPPPRRLGEEPLGGSGGDYIAPRRQPQTASGQALRRVGQQPVVRPDHEAQQLGLRPDLPGDQAAAQRPLGLRSPSSSPRTSSSGPGSRRDLVALRPRSASP